MPYSAPTIQEAGRQCWQALIPDIAFISRYLGIPIDEKNDWHESSSQVGYFNNHHERDTIEFHPLTTSKIKRTLGTIRPVGIQNKELALVQTIDNSNGESPLTATLEWNKSEQLTIESVTSETHGWSICVTAGFEAGNENAKFIGSLSLTASGEYSKSKAESKSSTIEGGGSIQVNVPPGKTTRLIQSVQSGEVEMDVTDEIILDLGFRVSDWKKRTNDQLNGHAGYARKGHSRSRWHWDCLSTDDFRTMMEGQNPRYPSLDAKYLNEKCFFQINRLLDETKRTIIVKSKAKFKRGIWGDARVETPQ